MPLITTDDDVKLYYEETGTGDPILFLHEFGGHYLSWEPQVRYFSRWYRCITYAARGWPPSDIPEPADGGSSTSR
jgi:pimeloyl-ACP methyl ester carboxylesterase